MSELHDTLQGLHRELARANRLEPDDRALLETVLADIRRLLDTPKAATTAPETTSAQQPGDALEGVAVKLEAGHPGVAAAIRSVLDALGKAGI